MFITIANKEQLSYIVERCCKERVMNTDVFLKSHEMVACATKEHLHAPVRSYFFPSIS